jgi:DNA ligase (NAD+)
MNKQNLTTDELLYIKYCNSYYAGKAEISDEEFDILESKIKNTIPDSPVLSMVREGFIELDEKYLIKHKYPFYSLEKVRNEQKLQQWANNNLLFVTVKMDGSAGSLVYENGKLKHSKSGGNKEFGKNTTKFMKYIDIPKEIDFKDTIEFRGEFVISKSNFDKLKQEYINHGLEEPKSIRNIVAGLLNPKKKQFIEHAKYLTFVAYDVLYDTSTFNNEYEKFVFMKKYFNIPDIAKCYKPTDIPEVIKYYIDNKDTLKFATDGIVFSINDIQSQLHRGFTDKYPKGKIAYKLEIDTGITKIINIIRDVTRTGKISLVAEVEPIELSGAIIRHVTLHNLDYISNLNIGIGAIVEILRSGEIIPKIVNVIEPGYIYFPVKRCPSCYSTLEFNGIDQYCTNGQCPAKNIKMLIYQKDVFEFENIGDSTVETLYKAGLLTSVIDFFNLENKINEICLIDGLGKRKAELIVESINSKRKNLSISACIKSFGLPNIGNKASIQLSTLLTSLDDILTLTRVSLNSIDGFGDTIIDTILNNKINLYEYLLDINNIDDVNIIFNNNITKAESKVIVITGKLSRGRKIIVKDAEAAGLIVSGSVNKKTDYLICNEPSNSSKYKKAIQLNIPIITEADLYNIINN